MKKALFFLFSLVFLLGLLFSGEILAQASAGGLGNPGVEKAPGERDFEPLGPQADPLRSKYAVVCCSANDFYPFEISPYELNELMGSIPPQLCLQDRDGFPAAALFAYFTLRDILNFPEENIILLLFHDDEAGISLCEPNEDDDGTDEFVSIAGAANPNNDLHGPDGKPGVAFVDDDENGIQDDEGEIGWPGSDDPKIAAENMEVTPERLRATLEDLAGRVGAGDDVVIYLVDHGVDLNGLNAGYHFESGEATPLDPGDDYVTAEQFSGWVDSYFSGMHRPRRLILLADFCKSGSFILPFPSGENRIAVSSSDEFLNSFYNMDARLSWPAVPFSGSVFFFPFWLQVSLGKCLEESFDMAWSGQAMPPICWGFNQAAGMLQFPLLQDFDLGDDVDADLMLPQVGHSLYDLDWKPWGTCALCVGTQGRVKKYDFNLQNNAYQDQLIRAGGPGEPDLWGVEWNYDGTLALIVGFSGKALAYNGEAFSDVNTPTTGDLYDVDWTPVGSRPWLHNLKALAVGKNGIVLEYDGNSFGINATSGLFSHHYHGIDFNPNQILIPRGNQGEPDIFITEALLCGTGSILRYRYYSYEYLEPSLDYVIEELTEVHTDVNIDLWGVQWHPENDTALLGGSKFIAGGNIPGIIFLYRGPQNLSSTLLSHGKWVRDVCWKPDGEFAVLVGTDALHIRHRGGRVRAFEMWDGFQDPQVIPHFQALWGTDWKHNRSHTLSVGSAESYTRFQIRYFF